MSTKSQIVKSTAAAGGIAGIIFGGTSFLAAVGTAALGAISGGLMADVLLEGMDNKTAQEYKRRKAIITDAVKQAFAKPAEETNPPLLDPDPNHVPATPEGIAQDAAELLNTILTANKH